MARTFHLPTAWRTPLRIAAPISHTAGGMEHLTATVAGERVWFESPDLSLRESSEALGSAFLIPAAAMGRRLKFESAPEPGWLSNAGQAQNVVSAWWGYPSALPGNTLPAPHRSAAAANGRTALCFTGGVDSFYSLLRSGNRIDHLLFVHGYDITLADTRRAAAVEASLRSIAAARGAQFVWVRTNLRQHRAFRKTKWDQTHGGALAAVGHLLAEHVGHLLISASYPRVFDRPWGSHWTLDPWWSSSRLTVTHVGAEKWRAEKLVAIMDEPLVRRHLRVCWENRSPLGNCGACEKCLRTMLVLDGHGCLDQFPVFPTAALADNLDRLPNLKPDLIRVYASFLDLDLSNNVRAALCRLLARCNAGFMHGETRSVQHA